MGGGGGAIDYGNAKKSHAGQGSAAGDSLHALQELPGRGRCCAYEGRKDQRYQCLHARKAEHGDLPHVREALVSASSQSEF